MHLVARQLIGFVFIILLMSELQAQDRRRFLQSRFDSIDKNGDGQISAAEAGRPFLVRRFDNDRDGNLSINEFRALIESVVGDRSPNADEKVPWKASPLTNPIADDAPISETSILAAAQYSASHHGISFLVMYDGQLIYADYPNGGAGDRAHELASGTKSFTGVLAIAAIEDGIIESLEENVSDTITEWKNDPPKSKITVRHLLDLTSGIDPGSSTSQRVPSYQSAIQNQSNHWPGEEFEYGPAHFQCFGEFLRRKLSAAGSNESVLGYMQRRLFDPIGLKHGRWRTDSNGQAHLPSGVHLTAAEWAKFGELVRSGGRWSKTQLIERSTLDQCFIGSTANPAYGLTFWLNEPVTATTRRSIPALRFGTDNLTTIPQIPDDLIFAAGAGKQRLFISRDAKLVVVRQAEGIVGSLNGQRSSYSDAQFLKRLMKH